MVTLFSVTLPEAMFMPPPRTALPPLMVPGPLIVRVPAVMMALPSWDPLPTDARVASFLSIV